MVGGEIVEEGLSDALFAHPAHPYTAKLIAAVPDVARGLAARSRPTPRCFIDSGMETR